jgi:glycosyltransferase involved in cell wall biosynthesis
VIAYLSQAFPKGTETFTYDEVRALADRGLAVRVYSFRAGDELGWPLDGIDVRTISLARSLAALARAAVRHPLRLLQAAGWVVAGRFLRPPTRRERLATLAALPRGALLALEPGIDLYHAQFANETATAALVAAHLTGRPFSFRSHTAPNPQLLERKLARAAVVLAISEDDRRRLLERAPEGRIELARLGVEAPEDPGPNDRPPLIAAVGSLIEKKGHHVLVEACALLAARGVVFTCEIAGKGPLRGELQRRIEAAGLADRVVLRGHLPRPETLALLGRARIAALASVPSAAEGEDGIPIALVEALARATPAVATALAGIPELVVDGETGLLVEPGDAEGLADALQRLLGDRQLARTLGAAGRQKVVLEYDPDACFGCAAELLRGAMRR